MGKTYLIHSAHNIMDVNQPPGTIYILRGAYEAFLFTARILTHILHLNVGTSYWLNDKLLPFFFRFPSILADLVQGFLIYLIVKSKAPEKRALAGSALYLFCPPVVYNSTVWGQIDSLNNLFFFLALIFLLKKQPFPSVLFYALSLFIKLSLLPLVPIYLLFSLLGGFFKPRAFLLSLIASAIIIWVLCLPFSNSPFWIIGIAQKASQGISSNITNNAFNFWWLLFDPLLNTGTPSSSSPYFGLSLNIWAYLIFGLTYVPVILSFQKLNQNKKPTTGNVFLLCALIAFSSFLFLPKMHERYLYPVLPLIIAWTGVKGRSWVMAILLSFVHFFNLYLVWNPRLFLFKNMEPFLKSQISTRFLSLVTILIFIYYLLKLKSISRQKSWF